MMSEAEGCALLKGLFEAAGFEIQEHFPFRDGTVDVALDGYDEKRGVGYEYVTTEAGDRAEMTPEVIGHLEARMRRGEIFVLLVDEFEVADEATLRLAVRGFLEAARQRGHGP